MFKSFLLAALLPAMVLAQNASTVEGLAQHLSSIGLTNLATLVTTVNASGVGQSLLANISNGEPHLLFAPSNQAITSAPSNITSDPGRLTDVFGYHIVPGNFSNSTTNYPNVTLGRTLLTDPTLVHLEGGNKAQVVAWAVRADGKTHVLNQRNDSTVTNTSSFGNITIWTVDHILVIPENFEATIPTNTESLTGVETILRNVQTPVFDASSNQTSNTTLFNAINDAWHGFTFFAPNTDAVNAAQSSIQSLASNATAVQNVLYNHIINGTTLYSPLLAGQNYTSTAGEGLSFSINSTGQYVTSGNVTARIVQPDVLLPNGVIHVIDRVLLNTESNSGAASSAIASATSAATARPTETQPIGFSQTATLQPSGTGGAGSNGSGNSSGAVAGPGMNVIYSLAVTFVGVVVGAIVTVA
ncbi:Fasciclin-domain-containing protein [Panus rudis PR-1116 ss-1]|nr:Fasciclin-domain-containing protein [Panus rudis PR-1116 ss-1]